MLGLGVHFQGTSSFWFGILLVSTLFAAGLEGWKDAASAAATVLLLLCEII